MLSVEARWFEQRLAEFPVETLCPMLNVGSNTGDFRTRVQPWIDRHVFAPLRARGGLVQHLDLQWAEGVDIVGDLTDPVFLKNLGRLSFRSAFCSNLLEHVIHPENIARRIVEILPVGGAIFVSCPHRFPYHPDPIDTMFRPGVAELAAIFPGTRIVHQAILRGETLFGYLLNRVFGSPWAFFQSIGQRTQKPSPPPEAGKPGTIWDLLPWMFTRFEETCLVLRKE